MTNLADGYSFMLDACSKFHNSLFVHGWFHHEADGLNDVGVEGVDCVAQIKECGIDHGGVRALGPDKGFMLQIMMANDRFPTDAVIVFQTRLGKTIRSPLLDLADQRNLDNKSQDLFVKFKALADALPGSRMLDIGGRDRSGVDYSRLYPNNRVTVFDVLPGENVDVVGDAHELTRHFPERTFEFLRTSCVFEHILMPWKTALEMARVAKMGAIGVVHTHQTLGIHDQPCDYWRFSDESWKALFNHRTGFRIIDTAMAHESFILPFIWRTDKVDAEKSAGFESSTVLIQKVAEPTLEWDLVPEDITSELYPA